MVHGTAEHMGQRWSAGSRRRVRERSQSAAAMRWNSPIRNTGKEGGAREGDLGGSIWIPHHGGGRTMAHATMVSVSRCGKRALGPVGKCRYHIPNRLGRPSTSASPETHSSAAACSALLFLWRLASSAAATARLGDLRGRGESHLIALPLGFGAMYSRHVCGECARG